MKASEMYVNVCIDGISAMTNIVITGIIPIYQCSHQDFALGSPRAPSSEK